MADKKLLIDSMGTLRLSLHESTDGTHKLIARGEFGRADIPTENKRIYPRSLWEREIAKIIEGMHANQVYGELDHPGDGKTKLTRVSHLMKDLTIQPDGIVVGEAQVLDTPNGEILKKIRAAGGEVGISSRGYGSTARNEDGYEVVQEDYTYMTHDFVADPAVKSAFPKFQEEGKAAKKETQVMETKVEKEATVVNPADGGTYTEAELQAKLKEHTEKLAEKYSQELITKLAEVKESVSEDIRNKLMSDPTVAGAKLALEKVKDAIRPFVVPEDVELVIKGKDEEIAALKTQLADKAKEMQATEAKAVAIGESAKNLTLKFALNDLLGKYEHRKEAEEMIGDVKGYKNMEALSEAVEKVKLAVSKKKEEEKAKADEAARLAETHQKELNTLKEELEAVKKTAKEALGMASKYQLALYAEQKLKGNPNAAKIKKMIEGVETKEKIDEAIATFSVDQNQEQEYNFIQNRLKARQALEDKARSADLVAQHLEETTGHRRTPAADSVDAELGQLGQMDL